MGNRVLEVGERIRELGERLQEREEGQGMVEYALILVLISIVVIVILSTLGKTVNNVFSNVSHGLVELATSSPPRAAGPRGLAARRHV